jgi:hypothetical protein
MFMDKHIQAYFFEQNDAQSVMTTLKALGAKNVRVERTSDLEEPDDPYLPIFRPQNEGVGTGTFINFQPGVAIVNEYKNEGSIFRNNDVDSEATGRGQPILTAMISEEKYDQAVNIIRQHSGTLES